MRHQTKNIQQAGRSMIEMLGVLAVIGVLTVGGFALISKVSNAHKANVVIDEIGTLANKTRRVFHDFIEDNYTLVKENTSTANPMTAYVQKAGAYPDGLSCEEDCVSFSDNNDVKFTISQVRKNVGIGDNTAGIDYFVIKIEQLSDNLCMAVAQASWGSPSINGFSSICVGTGCEETTHVKGEATPDGYEKGGKKLSLDAAADACSDETDNTVYLTFR